VKQDWVIEIINVQTRLLKPRRRFSINKFSKKRNELVEVWLLRINVIFQHRQEMVKFYNKFYSSNIMTAAVYGKQSLDELEKMATGLLAQVPNKQVTKPSWDVNPLAKPYTGYKVRHATIKDDEKLMSVVFGAPYLAPEKRHLAEYTKQLIDSDHKGGLKDNLKKRGLIVDYDSHYSTPARGYGSYKMWFELTEQGVNKTNEILLGLFKYINMAKNRGPKPWEIDQLTKQRENTFNTLVSYFQYFFLILSTEIIYQLIHI